MATSLSDFTERGALAGRGQSLAALGDAVKIMGRGGLRLFSGGGDSLLE